MQTEPISPEERPEPRVRVSRTRTKASPKPRRKKREDRLKSVIVRFRITPQQEQSILAEYPDVRISMLARRRLLGKRVGSPELRAIALDVLTEVKESEQALRGLHSLLDSEAASHPFGGHLARAIERLAAAREQTHELFTTL